MRLFLALLFSIVSVTAFGGETPVASERNVIPVVVAAVIVEFVEDCLAEDCLFDL